MEIIEKILFNAEVKLKDFKKRDSQLKMIEKVKEVFENKEFAVIEAPTGTGKSLAYLIPSVDYIKKTNEKIIISTASINLQEQLIKKDIKSLEKIMPFSLKFGVIKGIKNYLCKRRLDELIQNFAMYDLNKKNLEELIAWSKTTKTGDKDELSFVDNLLWEEVCSSTETCAGSICPDENVCLFKKAKKLALESDIIVTNHHLLFTDLFIRNEISKRKLEDENEDEKENPDEYNLILPYFKNVIIDEAHYIEEAARTIFTEKFSKSGLKRLFSKINKILLKSKVEDSSLQEPMLTALLFLEKIESLIRDRDNFEPIYRITENTYDTELHREIVSILKDLNKSLENYRISSISLIKELSDKTKSFELSKLINGIEGRQNLIKAFISKNTKGNSALWVEVSKHACTFNLSEIDLGVGLNEIMYNKMQSAIFTSATICINNDFSYFLNQVGLNKTSKQIEKLYLPHSFLYEEQAIFEVVKDIEEPNNEEKFLLSSLKYIKELIKVNKGGILILLTSIKSLKTVGEEITEFGKENNIEIFVQGQLPKAELINSFKASKSKSVLIGIKNFWEGIDIKGSKLTMVIIPKLPFQTPSDPISIAKNEIALKNGENPFLIETLPAAIIKFKQGFGRLIRSESDSGSVICLDKRLFSKYYGKFFLKALPNLKIKYAEFEEIKNDIKNLL